jgi:hypothetical protein
VEKKMVRRGTLVFGLLMVAAMVFFLAVPAIADCPDFFLRTDSGTVINPLAAENADQPYSPKQTCGICHDYEKITEGYHFQQGWDDIDDQLGLKKGKPWIFSPGMMGKW